MPDRRTLTERSLMARIGAIGRALLPAAVLALALPGAAIAAEWTGIWIVDPAWCKYKDQIGGHDPAPARVTATEITGQEITWEMAMNSKQDLTPKKLAWGPIETPAVAMPGVTKFV